MLKARGVPLSEREGFIRARQVFDESSFMSSKGVDLTLKPLMAPRLVRLLQPAIGKNRAEAKTRELIQIWKMFGNTQTTLESFV